MAVPFVTIGGFEVLLSNLLGEGTFGCVYKGKRLSDNQEVAAKRLKNYELNSDDPAVRNDIENVDKTPKHRNLVNILHHGAASGEYWIFMEFCDLGDLRNYFRRNTPDMTFKVHVMLESITGLCFLHENKIIHRDLKPQNILLQSQGEQPLPCVKITDFGLSKFLTEGQSSLMHTEVGTRAFQAPEMFEKDARTGKPNYRSSVDIFAMGLVFLAMLQTTGGEEEEHMIPMAEDSVQSEGEVLYKAVGEAMYMRSNSQPEIKVAVVTDKEDETVKNTKTLINQMTHIIHQRRPKASDVFRFVKRLHKIQEEAAKK